MIDQLHNVSSILESQTQNIPNAYSHAPPSPPSPLIHPPTNAQVEFHSIFCHCCSNTRGPLFHCDLIWGVTGGSIPYAAEGPSNPGSRGKAIMDDATDIPSGSAGRPLASIGPSFSTRDLLDGTLLVLMILAVSNGKFPTPGEMGRLIEATPLVATTNYPFLNKIADYSACPLSALLELEPDRLVRLTAVPAPNVAIVSLPSPKESTMTLASSLVELFLKDGPPYSAAAIEQPSQEHNEEWVNSMVDIEDEEMVDAASSKSVEVLVQGICHTPPRRKREALQERESSQHNIVYIEKLKHA
ncbi:hypothetical protein Tco_0697669 [Tanacetum coccineum]